MKFASDSTERYFGTITAIEELNTFKVSVNILDLTNNTYQSIIDINLAPCSFSSYISILENYVLYEKESKNEYELGYVSLQIVSTTGLGVINFVSVRDDSVSVNYSVVNQEISNLILNLAKRILEKDPEFNKDCT